MAAADYPRGTVVFVPFPFTDLSGRKRRPALVVSPGGFDGEDLILCAITSRMPAKPSAWEVMLEAQDMADEALPKRSVVKVGKLFTTHRRLVAGRYGGIEGAKAANGARKAWGTVRVLGRGRGCVGSGSRAGLRGRGRPGAAVA